MRRTRHRRRFHTERIVRVRRARYLNETQMWWPMYDFDAAFHKRLMSYGRLASSDPWDCGRAGCGICHDGQWEPRRAREERAWRKDWDC
jgi:hypothetical protein